MTLQHANPLTARNNQPVTHEEKPTKVILSTDLPDGIIEFIRLTEERLSELKRDIDYSLDIRVTVEGLSELKRDIDDSLDSLIYRVGRLEADGWRVNCCPDQIEAFHPDIRVKGEIEKRLAELELSPWDGVHVE